MPKSVKGKLIAIVFVVGLLGVGYAAGQYYLHGIYQRQVEVGYRRALGNSAATWMKLLKRWAVPGWR